MRGTMLLFELRGSQFQYFQKLFPNMPAYVLRDLIFKNYRNLQNPAEVQEIVQMWGSYTWKPQNLTITLNVFEPKTRKKLEARMRGEDIGFQIPKDVERHEIQQKLLTAGPSQEPIIVLATPQGYDLIEGWHRTIQSLKKWTGGYKQSAWIGSKQA